MAAVPTRDRVRASRARVRERNERYGLVRAYVDVPEHRLPELRDIERDMQRAAGVPPDPSQPPAFGRD